MFKNFVKTIMIKFNYRLLVILLLNIISSIDTKTI